ncbi:MAG: hypothetical protein NXI24_06425 [bacterium]|nr:hypothetical protein [bacterium]
MNEKEALKWLPDFRGGGAAAYRSILRPQAYFAETPADVLLRNCLTGLVLLLALGALIIFCAALWNAGELRADARSYFESRGVDTEDLPFVLRPGTPVGLLLFPIYWSGLLLFMSVMRFGILWLMNARDVAFARVFAVSGHAALSMIVVATLLGFMNQLFPITIDSPAKLPRVVFAMTLCTVAWLNEGRVWSAGARLNFQIGTGPAVLTWLVPFFAAILLIISIFFAFSIFVAGGAA